MNLDEYQTKALAFAAERPQSITTELTIGALGLTGESGEFADMVKKIVAQGHETDLGKMAAELGDVLWYVAYAARTLGIPLSIIADQNIAKLARRYPEGKFSVERSTKR